MTWPSSTFLKNNPGQLGWPEQLALPLGSQRAYFTDSWLSSQACRPLSASSPLPHLPLRGSPDWKHREA